MNEELAITTVPFSDMERMAQAIAKSGLFAMRTTEQALALMCVAQAEGRHPGSIATDYHIINGQPSLKSDVMLARFLDAGGKVNWEQYNDDGAIATFSHPMGGSVRIDWDEARAKKAGLTGKENWKKYTRQMYRARAISEGVTTVYPGVKKGMYTPEEVREFTKEEMEQTETLPAAGRKYEIKDKQPKAEKIPPITEVEWESTVTDVKEEERGEGDDKKVFYCVKFANGQDGWTVNRDLAGKAFEFIPDEGEDAKMVKASAKLGKKGHTWYLESLEEV